MSVYFAASGEYIKIGFSKDPFRRLGTVTRAGIRPDDVPYAADAQLLGYVPGDRWRETEIHGRFTDKRVKGEWFRQDILAEVRTLIWDDPRGVDVQRMSAMAVFACDKYPEMTRDELEAAGIQIEGASIEEATRLMSERMARVFAGCDP